VGRSSAIRNAACLRLTEEQYDLLDLLAGNRRCLFELQPKLALVDKEALKNGIPGRLGSEEDYRPLTSSSYLAVKRLLHSYEMRNREPEI
jgi:hypothetical protein